MPEYTSLKLPGIDEFFLEQRINEALGLIRYVSSLSDKPLIIQFSGGRDSLTLVDLVRKAEVINFLCCYMVSGIDFQESVEFATSMGRELGVTMLFSHPSAHKGGFFERLAYFRRWPTVQSTWCSRDLKIRPQVKTLQQNFGRGTLYKLNGVRRWESGRRRVLYPSSRLISPDPEHKGSFQVQPLLNWTGADVENYLKMKGLPSSGLYKRYGVSGCFYCPFYQTSIYRGVLRSLPNIYDEFIEWEGKLQAPSVIGEIYLRDLKAEVLSGMRTSNA